MTNYLKTKQKVWVWYCKWRQNPSFCPAFNCNIKVSLKGWNHLTGATSYKKRGLADKYRRLMLLTFAKEVVEKSSTIQNIVEKYGRVYYALEAMIKIKEKNKSSYRKIRVILIEDKQGNKIFYSVMDKKQKIE